MADNNKKEGFFSRLTRKIGGKLMDEDSMAVIEKKQCETGDDTQKNISNFSQIECKNELIKSVEKTLSRLIEEKDYTKGKKLIIWLDTDQLSFDSYNTSEYEQTILRNLVNEHGYFFDAVGLCIGMPDAKLRATRIGRNEKEYIQIISSEPEVVCNHSKAKICVVGSFGSLVDGEYFLSVDDMKNRRITAYNIGSGRFPKLKSGFRENHIAIDDNPDSPMIEQNKYVSRMHAHIGFSERFGFYLQVEIDGTRLMGKRTRIFRGLEVIECDSPNVKNYLKDNDIIELGKAVKLQYFELD